MPSDDEASIDFAHGSIWTSHLLEHLGPPLRLVHCAPAAARE